VKDQFFIRLYPSLRKIEDRILTALQPWRHEPGPLGHLDRLGLAARQPKV